MSLILRPYQIEAIHNVYRYFEVKTGNPLIVIPTAGGKSLVMATFVRAVLDQFPDQRILIVTHVRELIEQNFEELKALWPEAPAGIYSAGLKKRESDAQIVFAGIQSVHKKVNEIGHCDLVLIDEAHLIPQKADAMYQKFLDGLKAFNPLLKVIGFTATPFRLDSGMLHESKNAVFTDIAFEASIRELIEAGYLARIISKKTDTELDVSGVGIRGGEFIAAELEKAVDQDDINQAVVNEICKKATDRKSLLVFCSGVDHAYHVRDVLRQHGIQTETIVGSTPTKERDQIIQDFREGKIRCLTNANVLTTGFNVPGVDLIALLRPTKSAGLYIQIVGRGCRVADKKENCLVLDFAGNIARHGPIDAIRIKRHKNDKKGEGPPSKVCPSCKSYIPAAAATCPDCGHQFPPPKIELYARPSELNILSSNDPIWIDVSNVTYNRHQKPGKPPSLKVDYRCGLITHTEWVCFEHDGYAAKKAKQWWARRAPSIPAPKTITQALSLVTKLKKPSQIAIKPNGKYVEIVSTKFA